MNKTSIEWVKNPDGTQGYTWNPITGCLNHIDGMCKGGNFPCYAYKLANGRLRTAYLGGNCTPAPYEYNSQVILDPFYPRFWEGRLFEMNPIARTGKGIFVCDMSDLFGIGIPHEWTERVIHQINLHPEHRFYLLTKQPQNLIKFSPFPDNCWVGVTATNPPMTKDACYWLREIEAPTKFISFEPLLDDVAHIFFPEYIDWLIIGAQTKPYKPPEISWVEEIVRAADKAGIPVFLKDNLKPLILSHAQDKDAYWADCILDKGGQLRQELPNDKR